MPNRNHSEPLLKERAQLIELLVLDVDGVLTDGRIYFDNNGGEFKSFFHARRPRNQDAAKIWR